MADIIDTTDNYIYLILMITILILIIKTDTNVFILYSDSDSYSGEDTFSKWFRDLIDNYWPSLIGILTIVLFILFNKGGEGSGYITLFILIFSAVFLTSYTIFQWETGGERRGQRTTRAVVHAECTGTATGADAGKTCTDSGYADSRATCPTGCDWKPGVPKIDFKYTPSECSGILPKSNQFQTKEYQFFRFIYYFTLIIIATCAANNMSESGYFSNIVIILPFLIPLFMELVSEMVDFIKDETIEAKLSPELFLIHFIRGIHTGGDSITSMTAEASGGATAVGYSSFKDINWLQDEGQGTFFNGHFMVSMIFYMILILLMIYYSQGLGDNPISNTPIYWGLTIMIGFPFFMRYIFIQEGSINEKKDMLPDGIKNNERIIPTSGESELDTMGPYKNTGTGCTGTADLCENSAETAGLQRIEKKEDLTCRIEKYGGIQMIFCASLIIMILTKTHQKSNKVLAFGIMILLTYGLSQTFIYTDVYDQK